MRILAVAFTLALSAACVSASAVESAAVMKDLLEKGAKAGQDIDDLIRRDRPQAALVLMNRHVREVEDIIEKVEKDPQIALDHKAPLMKQLRGYHSELSQSAAKLRAMINLAAQMEDR